MFDWDQKMSIQATDIPWDVWNARTSCVQVWHIFSIYADWQFSRKYFPLKTSSAAGNNLNFKIMWKNVIWNIWSCRDFPGDPARLKSLTDNSTKTFHVFKSYNWNYIQGPTRSNIAQSSYFQTKLWYRCSADLLWTLSAFAWTTTRMYFSALALPFFLRCFFLLSQSSIVAARQCPKKLFDLKTKLSACLLMGWQEADGWDKSVGNQTCNPSKESTERRKVSILLLTSTFHNWRLIFVSMRGARGDMG